MRWLGCGMAGAAVLAGGLALAQKGAAPAPPLKVTVLATTDEHGWLEPLTQKGQDSYQGGMAYLMGQLVGREGYRPRDAVLLSGGDMWTGPYEDTVLQGRPMVQIMNAMGYDAASIGNHDFDFGQEALQKRAHEAGFPLLSANLFIRGTRSPPPYVRTHTLTEAAGVKVGLVGLTTLETPYTTDARNLGGLELGPYEEALQRVVPEARAQGAQVVVLLAHADLNEMRPLAPLLRRLGVSLVICGHRHNGKLETEEGGAGIADDVVFCNPGPYARSYCRVDLTVDAQTGALLAQKSIIEMVAGLRSKPSYAPSEGILGVAAEARTQAETRGAEVLATIPAGLTRAEPVNTMGYLVVDSWLDALPYAEFAFTNTGGFRQDVDGGPVRMRDIIGAMPFDNYLMVVSLTTEQIMDVMENPQTLPGGLTAEVSVDAAGKRAVKRLLDRRGQPLEAGRKYRCIVNDFMYRGGDRYRLKEYDPNPEETAMHWREPVVRYLRAAGKAGKPVTVATSPRLRPVP
ncbi:MAG: bifunctional metallophosphatase/5'-nucleotidase [Deltaproteobacteria bacterium]|nr:bifunctional metallophosphatase/5'-nucleotidase [Deltaproteobacteria bacterium]